MNAAAREPWCAGRFYPGTPGALATMVDELLASDTPPRPARALVAPHAGYVYSGGVAGQTFARTVIPRDVILIGPKHTGLGAPLATDARPWQVPGAVVPVNEGLTRALQTVLPELVDDPRAHAREHCLEVEVPFLLRRQPDLHLVPIVVSGDFDERSCDLVARALADVVSGWPDPVLLVASSDMHHQGTDDLPPGRRTDEVVRAKSARALERLDAFDPHGLLRRCRAEDITMCGVVPTTIVLEAARLLGATHTERVAFTDSQAVRPSWGAPEYTVGYAGYRIVDRASANA